MSRSVRSRLGIRPGTTTTKPSNRETARREGKERTVTLGGGKRTAYPEPTSAGVSAVMRGNRKRDTVPEMRIRQLLHKRGLRYRVNLPIIAGVVRVRPDVVFTRLKIAVFVDGCYWHGCPRHGTQPRVNTAYWGPKIERNRARDARVTAALKTAGWFVIRIWEHEASATAVGRVEAAVARRRGLPRLQP